MKAHRVAAFLTLAFALAVSLAVVSGCNKDQPTEPTAEGVIVPLAVGNRWDYVVYDFNQGGTPDSSMDSIVVVGIDSTSGERRYSVNADEQFVNRTNGLWYKPAGTTTIYRLFAYPANVGTIWFSGIQGNVAMKLLSKTAQVTVPQGTYTCYRYIAEYPAGSGEGIMYYNVVPNVGIIQYEKKDSTGNNLEELGQLADVHLE